MSSTRDGEVQQVADSVHRLGSKSHNWYLIIDGDDVTVIDAGCDREWSKLLAALATRDIALERIAGFVITHVHGDHFGMARRARQDDIRVAVHADDEPRALGTYSGRFSAEASDLPIFNPRVLLTFLPMMTAGVTSMKHVDEVEVFEDGDILDVPGSPTAIHTPGHTEGHTMFSSAELGILFTGDGLVTKSLLGTGRGPRFMDEVFDVDSEQAHSSLDRIVDIEADLLLPGHGDPWSGTPARAVELARA